MEEQFLRFPLVGKQILDQLSDDRMTMCREVNNQWKEFIDFYDMPWIRITELYSIDRFQDEALHVAAYTRQHDIFVDLSLNTDLHPKNDDGITPLHLSAQMVHLWSLPCNLKCLFLVYLGDG